jgi:hypothetical protein
VAAVLNGAWAPLGWSIGFIEAPVDRVLATVVAIRRTEGQRVVLDDPGRGCSRNSVLAKILWSACRPDVLCGLW